MVKCRILSTLPATKCEAALAQRVQVCSASTRAVKSRWTSYGYTGQHKQRTISPPLEVKYCLHCNTIICETLNTPWTVYGTFWRCHSIIKGLVFNRKVSSCCSLQAAAGEPRLSLFIFSGCPFQSNAASQRVRVIATSHLLPAASHNYLMLPRLLCWNIITMQPTNGALRDAGNLGN